MLDYAIALLIGLLIPAYVGRIRHAEQRPLAAYLIFITVFVAAAALMSGVLGMLASELQLTPVLENPTAVFLYLTPIAAPAFALATWQARKPPPRRGPPD